MRRFFVPTDAVSIGQLIVTGPDARHIGKVLRMGPGDVITCVDGIGREHTARIVRVSETRVEAVIESTTEGGAAEPGVMLTLVQAIPKGDKMDLVVQKCTEIGVGRIMPVYTERTVVQPDADGARRKVERWRRIALESSKQCGRSRPPEICDICRLDQCMTGLLAEGLPIIIPWELEEDKSLKTVVHELQIPSKKACAFAIGPEGGFSIAEVEMARKAGVIPVTLGKRILRTETAGFVVATILLYEMSELGCTK